MPVGRDGFAVGAEVSVVTNCAFVADALNVRLALLVFTERTIAVDSVMTYNRGTGLWQWLVDGNEAMLWVDELRTLDTRGAKVPVWAIEALMANAIDEFLTPIANCSMSNVPAL